MSLEVEKLLRYGGRADVSVAWLLDHKGRHWLSAFKLPGTDILAVMRWERNSSLRCPLLSSCSEVWQTSNLFDPQADSYGLKGQHYETFFFLFFFFPSLLWICSAGLFGYLDSIMHLIQISLKLWLHPTIILCITCWREKRANTVYLFLATIGINQNKE